MVYGEFILKPAVDLTKLLSQEENKDEIMRILPKINESVNEHWISDKSRYSFDGLKIDRLTKIIYNDKKNYIFTGNWKLVIPTFSNYIEKISRKQENSNVLNLGKLESLDNLFVSFQFIYKVCFSVFLVLRQNTLCKR